MEVEIRPVKINVGGEEYSVKGDTDSQTILQIADFVNRRIAEISHKTPHQSNHRVTVLAALNIAEELFREKQAKDKQVQEFESRAGRLLEWLDHKLAEVSP